MTLDDLKERFTSEFKTTWERFQDSAVYNQMNDRYENMTPNMQKLTVFGGSAAIALLILSVPYSYYSQSSDYEREFESRRSTIRELLKVTRESSEVPDIPQAPPVDSLRMMIEGKLKSANLLPEQIKGTEVVSETSKLIPANLTEGILQVSLAKLNLHQVLDIGYALQSINPSVKMKDMVMTANREDSRYFDVVFKLVSLAVPEAPAPPPPEPMRGNRGQRDRSGDEG